MAKKRRKKSRRILKWSGLTAVVLVASSFALVLPLRWYAPATTAFMLRDGSGRDPLLWEWTAWPQLGSSLPLAAVAAEDQRFAEHFGLDLQSIQQSLEDARDGDNLRGASTITQQLAKNLFLTSSRSFLRKAIEAWFAVVMEICLPKRRILEIYLNVVELGPGIYGVGAASRYYFQRPPAALGDSDAALLAAVLPNPLRFKPAAPTPYVRERQRWILAQMQRLRREQWLLLLR